jgi:CarD family transcriptional regulator
MVRKATSNKSAAKKADAKKHAAPKAAARPSPSSAKTVPRKAQPASVHAKGAIKPAAKTDHANKAAVKKPSAQAKPVMVKPVAAKAQAKPVATAKPVAAQPAAKMKPVPPKAVLSHAPAGSQRIPTTAARQFGQAAAALAAPKAVAQKAMLSRQQPAPSKQAAAAVAAAKKPVNQRHGFKTNEWIVYPAHGVGRIVGIEEQEIAGMSLELFVITFEKDKMTLRVPTGKSASVGMRKLAKSAKGRRVAAEEAEVKAA